MLLRAIVLALAAAAPLAATPVSAMEETGAAASAAADRSRGSSPSRACSLPVVTGPCRAAIPRWAFSKKTGRCTRFTYGGCKGNDNNFGSKRLCERKCGKPKPKPTPVCEQKPGVTGRCRAVFRRWTFNAKTGECEEFTHGGCGGNGNRFDSEKECEASCVKPKPPVDVCKLDIVVGPCEAAIKSYGFDGKRCVEFVYGGCMGNGNRFETEAECDAACEKPTSAPPSTDICELDLVTGPCKAFIPSWGFDGEECVEFVYGGCGGNGNRFKTEAECKAACPPMSTCQLDIVPGPCKASIPRWGFDGLRCVEFTYGGCGGNANRFKTEEECESACRDDICALPTFPPDLLLRCLALIPAFTFQDGECTAFTYGGCGATANLFFTEEDCLELCGPRVKKAGM